MSTSLAVRIYKKYRDASISLVRNEPYRLASEVWGIGFKTADTIAQAIGIARDSPERLKAGLQTLTFTWTANANTILAKVRWIESEVHKLTGH